MLTIKRSSLGWLNIAKVSIYILFLNYYCFPVIRGSLIPYVSTICYTIMGLCYITDVVFSQKGRIRFGTEEVCWMVFAIIGLVTAPFAVSPSVAIKGVTAYGQRLFLIVLIVYICKKENSVRFPITLITVICAASAIAILPNLADMSKRIKLTSGYNISVNDIGSLLAYGSFTVLFFLDDKKIEYTLKITIRVAMLIIFIMTMFVSGSRKAFIGTIMLFSLRGLFGREKGKPISAKKALAFIVILLVAVIILDRFVLSQMYDTSLYARLFGEKAEDAAGSDAGRIGLYLKAYKDFINHPVFGLGFANFEVIHYVYTHSTYVEPLACMGVMGVLYLVPYAIIAKKQIYLVLKAKNDNASLLWNKRLLIFYIVFLYIAIGIPYIYKDIPCIVIALMISSQYIEEKRIAVHQSY